MLSQFLFFFCVGFLFFIVLSFAGKEWFFWFRRLIYMRCVDAYYRQLGVDFSNQVNQVRGAVSNIAMRTKHGLAAAIIQQCHFSPEDIFLDVGSGKGSVCMEASFFKFKKIIGVESDLNMVSICNDNFKRLNVHHIQVVMGDILEKKEVIDEATVFYFYEPFKACVFQQIIEVLIESKYRHPRQLQVILVCPTNLQLFLTHGFSLKTKGRVSPLKDDQWVLLQHYC